MLASSKLFFFQGFFLFCLVSVQCLKMVTLFVVSDFLVGQQEGKSAPGDIILTLCMTCQILGVGFICSIQETLKLWEVEIQKGCPKL